MLALLPYPDVLGIVTATAPLIDRQFGLCTQTSAVLSAAGFRLLPCRLMKAAAHTYIGASADSIRGIEGPTKLRASKG